MDFAVGPSTATEGGKGYRPRNYHASHEQEGRDAIPSALAHSLIERSPNHYDAKDEPELKGSVSFKVVVA